MKTYLYIRISDSEQENMQHLAIESLGLIQSQTYIDRATSKKYYNPAFQALQQELESGDLLYIKSLDILGKNYEDIKKQWQLLTKEKGIDIVVLDMPLLDTRLHKDLMGDLVADLIDQVLSFVAENEVEKKKKPQAAGIAAAKAKGIRLGRPSISIAEDLNFEELVRRWERKELSLDEVLLQCGFSKATFFRRLREYRRNVS